VSRRIDIELTSAQPDGRWTWRAAGARQPRGVLEGGVLYDGAKAGDVVRAEADFELDGIVIVSVLAPKEKKRSEPERIQLLPPSEPAVGGVTTQLVGKGDRRPPRRDGDFAGPRRDGDRRGPRDGGRGDSPRSGPPRTSEGGTPRSNGPGERSRGAGPRTSGPRERTAPDGVASAPSGPRNDRTRPNAERPVRDGARRGEGAARVEGAARGPASRGPVVSRGNGPEGANRGPRREGGEGRPSTPADRTRGRRLNPANVHRQAVLETLAPEQEAVAQQLLRGGIPAVRTAIALEREKAVAEGRSAPNSDELIALAEALLPRLKAAEWHDRAEAASKSLGEISLRDLRSVVAGADAARDDETRALATTLREALDARVTTLRDNWTEEIARHLEENRVVRALRLAGRPPETSARLPAELSERLSQAASAALVPETPSERWVALLEAVAESPVRRAVKPVGLPADSSPETVRAAHQQAGRVPALAALLGIAIPPPPGPRRPAGPPPVPRPPAPPVSAAPPVPAAPAPAAAPDVRAAAPDVAAPAQAPEDSAPAPEVAAAAPVPEVSTPAPAPASDVAAPAPEVAAPASEVAPPAPEASDVAAPAPAADVPGPASEVTTPTAVSDADGPGPAPEVSAAIAVSDADVSAPVVEGPAPLVPAEADEVSSAP
jgi:hypothetical protein